MTTVLVTGGAGYVGSHACKALAAAGYRPVVFDNLATGHEWAVKWGPLVIGDLADTLAVRDVLLRYDVRAVMHFAASTNVGESVREPAKYFRNNLFSSLSLLDAMVQAGVKTLVFSSTCASYGLPERVPIDEDHGQRPINPYGETKLMVEVMLRWFGAAHGLDWLAFRYFNAAGADPDGEIGEDHDPETHLIPLAIQTALGLRPRLDIFGADYPTPDGTAIRDYVHVTDLADAHLSGLAYLLSGGASTAINLGTGRGHSVREVIDMVARVSGRPLAVREAPRRDGDPPALVCAPARSATILGWQPKLSDLRMIVETAWQWHSQRQDLLSNVPL